MGEARRRCPSYEERKRRAIEEQEKERQKDKTLVCGAPRISKNLVCLYSLGLMLDNPEFITALKVYKKLLK